MDGLSEATNLIPGSPPFYCSLSVVRSGETFRAGETVKGEEPAAFTTSSKHASSTVSYPKSGVASHPPMSGVVLLSSGKDITQVCGHGIIIGRGKGAVGATAEGQDICECGGKTSCFSPYPPPHSLSPPFSSSLLFSPTGRLSSYSSMARYYNSGLSLQSVWSKRASEKSNKLTKFNPEFHLSCHATGVCSLGSYAQPAAL